MFAPLILSLVLAVQSVPAQTTQLPPPPPPVPAAGTPRSKSRRPTRGLMSRSRPMRARSSFKQEDKRAPITQRPFHRYVDSKRMDGFKFYRTTRSWGEGSRLIRAGSRGDPQTNFPPIAHEPTTKTGLTNCDGALVMAHLRPGDATTDFFCCCPTSRASTPTRPAAMERVSRYSRRVKAGARRGGKIFRDAGFRDRGRA